MRRIHIYIHGTAILWIWSDSIRIEQLFFVLLYIHWICDITSQFSYGILSSRCTLYLSHFWYMLPIFAKWVEKSDFLILSFCAKNLFLILYNCLFVNVFDIYFIYSNLYHILVEFLVQLKKSILQVFKTIIIMHFE